MTAQVIVLGGNFGGLNAALHIKHALKNDVHVKVISKDDRFLFNPSMIWLPFGKRSAKDITFDLEPTFTDSDVEFVHAAATRIDPDGKQVTDAHGTVHDFDYLVIATGYRNKMDVAEGFEENANQIATLEGAIRTGDAWKRFLENPGPIVIGATQSAGCFGAAYEFMFNTSYQLKKHGLKSRVDITYVTSEPFLGHFGINGMPGGEKLIGMFMGKEKIASVVNTSIKTVDTDHIVLADDTELPYALNMLMPPFLGQQVALESGLADEKGYIKVRDTWQTEKYDNIYAVGIAAAVAVPWTTPTPTGLPKTGFPTELMAKAAAHNIIAQVQGKPVTDHKEFKDMQAVCVMDAGNNGVMILGNSMMRDDKKGIMIPGPQNHAFKLAFEKYSMWRAKSGHVNLP